MNHISTAASLRRIGCAVVMMSAIPARAGSNAEFHPLGFLDPKGFGPVLAYGVSPDGQVVVGQGTSFTFEAFRWTESGGIQGLGALPNPRGFPSSVARGCSADGSIIVGASMLPDSLNEDGSPCRWTQRDGWQFLGSLGGSSGGLARDVSADGSVIVGYGSNKNFDSEAFRWTQAGGMVGLGDLPGGQFGSQAVGVSADGSVIVGSGFASTGGSTFKWTAAQGMVALSPTTFRVIGLSSDGRFAVGDNIGRAARLDVDNGNLLTIPHVTIPGLGTDTDQAWATNADGSVVVGMQNLSLLSGFFGRAFVWDATNGTRIIRDMLINDFGLGAELSGWELNNATAVSDDGLTIAGYGFAPSGEQAGWMVRLPGSPPVCPADLDGGGVVDGIDLGILLSQWSSDGSADLNDDHSVDGIDLGILLAAWGACR